MAKGLMWTISKDKQMVNYHMKMQYVQYCFKIAMVYYFPPNVKSKNRK